MSNEYRHVCFKDLENYFKIDDYFSNLTDSEIKLIQKNLNVPSTDDIKQQQTGIVEGSYLQIKELVDSNNLNVSCRYIVNDFQTIYISNTGEVWGQDKNPSRIYSVLLTPISSNTFSNRVSLLENDILLKWEVLYDFTQEELKPGIFNKGKITYLKDQNNNSAYYDFKNVLFNVTLKSSEIQGLLQDVSINMYTFSKINQLRCEDNSESSSVINNQFEQDCYENVFLGDTNNNHFYGGFKKNLFAKGCQYCKFEWNTTNNKFIEKISYSQGSIQNAYVTGTSYDTYISKEFRMVNSLQGTEPIFIVTFIDGDTLATQIVKLEKA